MFADGFNVPVVAFSAYAETTASYSPAERLQFDRTSTNIGNSYEPTTGIFTCPFDGVYVFHVFLNAVDASNSCIAQISLNGELRNGIFADNIAGGINNMAANTEYIECMAGNLVWVQAWSSEECYSSARRESTFSGQLVALYNGTVTN